MSCVHIRNGVYVSTRTSSEPLFDISGSGKKIRGRRREGRNFRITTTLVAR